MTLAFLIRMKKIIPILIVIFSLQTSCGGALTNALLTGGQGGALSEQQGEGLGDAESNFEDLEESNYADEIGGQGSEFTGDDLTNDDYLAETDDPSGLGGLSTKSKGSGLTDEDNPDDLRVIDTSPFTSGPTIAKNDENCEQVGGSDVTTFSASTIFRAVSGIEEMLEEDAEEDAEEAERELSFVRFKRQSPTDISSSASLFDTFAKFEVGKIKLNKNGTVKTFNGVNAQTPSILASQKFDPKAPFKGNSFDLKGRLEGFPKTCVVTEESAETGEVVLSERAVFDVMDVKLQVTRLSENSDVVTEIIDINRDGTFHYQPLEAKKGDVFSFTLYNALSDGEENGSSTLQLTLGEKSGEMALVFQDYNESSTFLKLDFEPQENQADTTNSTEKLPYRFVSESVDGIKKIAKPIVKKDSEKSMKGFSFEVGGTKKSIHVFEQEIE